MMTVEIPGHEHIEARTDQLNTLITESKRNVSYLPPGPCRGGSHARGNPIRADVQLAGIIINMTKIIRTNQVGK
jgi:hypothetical protein